MIIVSGCLIGLDCKYSGESNNTQEVHDYLRGKSYIPVCPEQLGGLSTPRPTCEIQGERVINEFGVDCTEQFEKGADEVSKIAEMTGATEAIFKEGSPSCGCNLIYDGTFSGRKIKGEGLTAKCLKEKGLKVISEKELL